MLVRRTVGACTRLLFLSPARALLAACNDRGQVLLVFCSVNGFLASSYFTLMLLDVVTISPTVQSLVKSVTKPGAQLAIVAYLFVIMVSLCGALGIPTLVTGQQKKQKNDAAAAKTVIFF